VSENKNTKKQHKNVSRKTEEAQPNAEKRITQIEAQLENLEQKKSELENKMLTEEDLNNLQSFQEKLENLQSDIDSLYDSFEKCIDA
jgi:ATP-binding cassette subfamily F protein 3